jgi:Flp pilus assembly protein CpaB
MDSGDPIVPQGEAAPGDSRRPGSSKLILLLVAAAVIVAAGFLFFRRGGADPGASTAAGSATSTPPAALSVVMAPVKLSPKAMLVADRFQCLCGECQDTLGKCTCTRDKGSNDMKAALNRIVEEKTALAEIEASMVEQFGSRVLVSNNPPGQPASK